MTAKSIPCGRTRGSVTRVRAPLAPLRSTDRAAIETCSRYQVSCLHSVSSILRVRGPSLPTPRLLGFTAEPSFFSGPARHRHRLRFLFSASAHLIFFLSRSSRLWLGWGSMPCKGARPPTASNLTRFGFPPAEALPGSSTHFLAFESRCGA